MTNTLIDEVRKARAALAEEHGYDRQKIYEWARKAHKARKQTKQRTKPEQVAAGNRLSPVPEP